ncbi:hypothetical protein HDU67_009360 [Dinochytrium kinnereticum]|nr:hypothetical protein HDU67_009360 [Dinochytrium kinnereticum]
MSTAAGIAPARTAPTLLSRIATSLSSSSTSTRLSASLVLLITFSRLDTIISPNLRSRSKLLAYAASLSRHARRPFGILSSNLRAMVSYLETKSAPGGQLHALAGFISDHRLESFLLAWLPTSVFGKRLHTGVYAIDMFVTSLLATVLVAGVTVGIDAGKHLIEQLTSPMDGSESVLVRVEHMRRGAWWTTVNEHYCALAWLITRQCTSQTTGSYRLVPYESEFKTTKTKEEDDEADLLDDDGKNVTDFNILPSTSESALTFQHGDHEFRVTFDFDDISEEEKKSPNYNPREPSMILQRINAGPTSTVWMKEWISTVTREFVRFQRSNRVRGRYEYDPDEGSWSFVHALHSSRGIMSVALDEAQEEMLSRDLEAFFGDQEFYKRMGMPYRRGFLFSGPPGTGKTSLINAISAQYVRDIYQINLADFENDKQLQNAFSRVPKNSIIVFEDVDAQSRSVWDRERRRVLESSEISMTGPSLLLRGASTASMKLPPILIEDEPGESLPSIRGGGEEEEVRSEASTAGLGSNMVPPVLRHSESARILGGPTPPPPSDKGPTLATLLNCLDGHSLNEGIICAFTSNHPEVLDPALTRPGRVDLHLHLGYCTHYQLNRMFQNVCEDATATLFLPPSHSSVEGIRAPVSIDEKGRIPWEDIEDGVIAPCDAMRIMMLHRREPWMIAAAVSERCEEIRFRRPGVASGGKVV